MSAQVTRRTSQGAVRMYYCVLLALLPGVGTVRLRATLDDGGDTGAEFFAYLVQGNVSIFNCVVQYTCGYYLVGATHLSQHHTHHKGVRNVGYATNLTHLPRVGFGCKLYGFFDH